MSREEKTIQFKIQAQGISTNAQGQEVGKIEAFGAMYGNVDDGGDKILPTAFRRTIQNSKARSQKRNNPYLLKMLWQHQTDQVIGSWYDVDTSDPEGLRCKGDILLATEKGREFYELAKAEMMDEFSIIYEVMPGGATYTKDGVRELSELRLFSVDPVTWGMNDKTYMVGIKSKSKDKPVDKEKKKQRKTFEEHYNDEAAQDLLEDWSDIWLCSLTCAVFDAFTIGDQPASDISDAIDAFKESVLSKFVTQAQDCDLSGYLSDNAYSYTPGLSQMQNGSDGGYGYGYMSRSTRELLQKAGRSISAANQSSIDDHVSNLHDMATKAMKAMKDHTNALHDAADAFAEKMAGNQADSDEEPDDNEQDDQTEKSYLSALRELKALRA